MPTISKLYGINGRLTLKECFIVSAINLCTPGYVSFLCRLHEEITGEQIPRGTEFTFCMLGALLMTWSFASVVVRLARVRMETAGAVDTCRHDEGYEGRAAATA